MPMTESPGDTDPWPRLTSALDQTQRQVDAFGADELGRPTPCAGYDGRTLLAHLVAVLRKLAAAGRGEETTAVEDPATDVTGGWGEEFRRARTGFERVWSAAALDQSYTVPWATMAGHELLDAYTHEFTVHSWDLAHTTGRLAELDSDLAEKALEAFPAFAPPEERRRHGPFAPAVPVPDDADVYTRLAAYLGRRP